MPRSRFIVLEMSDAGVIEVPQVRQIRSGEELAEARVADGIVAEVEADELCRCGLSASALAPSSPIPQLPRSSTRRCER